MGSYELPELGYDYGALEPHYSGKILELHHGKHHAAYVKGANKTVEQLEEARANETSPTSTSWRKTSRFTRRDTFCTRSSGRT